MKKEPFKAESFEVLEIEEGAFNHIVRVRLNGSGYTVGVSGTHVAVYTDTYRYVSSSDPRAQFISNALRLLQ